MMRALLFGAFITAVVVSCAYDGDDPELSAVEQEMETEYWTETSTSTSTDINWMYVGHCDPNRSHHCSVVCANDAAGIFVMAGTCEETSCRVPDRDGVCIVADCYGAGTYEACREGYTSITAGVRFCCKPYGD